MSRISCIAVAVAATLCAGVNARAQCTEQGPLNNHLGPGTVVCPCFIPGEQAGAIFSVPANEYPVEILKIGVGFGSQFGGSPQVQEQAIHIYEGSLPDPGAPSFSLLGPVLNDGAINQFDISLLPGDRIIESGPFTVTLEFLNQTYNDLFAPTVVHDGTGGTLGKNVVYAIPGGWNDAVTLGVTGNWVFFVTYRSLAPTAAVGPSAVVFNDVPAYVASCDTIAIRNEGCDTLSIAGIIGCDSGPFSVDTTLTAHEVPPNDSTHVVVCVTPAEAGPDACVLNVVSNASNGTQTIDVALGAVSNVGGTVARSAQDMVVVPNPFNPTTAIRFYLQEPMLVSAAVFAVDGRRIRTLADDRAAAAGDNVLRWDGRDDAGEAVASGVYLIRITTPAGSRVRRAVLIK